MSLRDHEQTIAPGSTAKIVSNDATMFYVKETSAPLPVVRTTYDGGRAGSSTFKNVKQGDKYTTPAGGIFTQIEIENTSAASIDVLISTGSGDYAQNSIDGNVLIQGGALDSITNAVEVFAPSGLVTSQGAPINARHTDHPAGALAIGASAQVAPSNPNRLALVIQNTSATADLLVRQDPANTAGSGLLLKAGQTMVVENRSETTLENIGTSAASYRIAENIAV